MNYDEFRKQVEEDQRRFERWFWLIVLAYAIPTVALLGVVVWGIVRVVLAVTR